MQQGGGMDKFNRRRQAIGPGAGIAIKPGCGQGQKRADAFPPGGDQIGGELRDQRHLGMHIFDNHGIDLIKVIPQKGGEPVKRVGHGIRCLHFHRRCIHGNWIKAEWVGEQAVLLTSPSPHRGEGRGEGAALSKWPPHPRDDAGPSLSPVGRGL
jgi:hypothetical protein